MKDLLKHLMFIIGIIGAVFLTYCIFRAEGLTPEQCDEYAKVWQDRAAELRAQK